MAGEQRIFLVKPGDTLVFGNVEATADAVSQVARFLHDEMGLRLMFFDADIDMAAVPGDGGE